MAATPEHPGEVFQADKFGKVSGYNDPYPLPVFQVEIHPRVRVVHDFPDGIKEDGSAK